MAKRRKKSEPMRLSDLTPWDRNPRDIEVKAAGGLRESMDRFGDLSGIVYNTRLRALVCGHQRTSQATELCNGENPTIEMISPERGLLAVGGETFTVRLVDWDEATHAAANIAANSPTITGDFNQLTGDLLLEMAGDHELWEALALDSLAESLPMAKDLGLDELLGAAVGPHAHKLETRPYEHFDYVLILASKVGEWNQLCDKLRLQKRSVGRDGAKKVGLCRAIHAAKLLELLNDGNEKESHV